LPIVVTYADYSSIAITNANQSTAIDCHAINNANLTIHRLHANHSSIAHAITNAALAWMPSPVIC
jgi:hypothetical protein